MTRFSIFSLAMVLACTAMAVGAQTNDSSLLAQVNQLADKRQLNAPLYQQALKSEDLQLNIATLKALARIGGKEVSPLVMPFLSHADANVRRAAAFALGLSGDDTNYEPLWTHLNKEASPLVRREIYLALASIPQPDFITRVLIREPKEKNPAVKEGMFQALTIAMVFKADLPYVQSAIFYPHLLLIAKQNDALGRQALSFIGRIPKIANRLPPRDLEILLPELTEPDNIVALAKLIAKVEHPKDTHNQKLKEWLLAFAQNKSTNQSVRLAAIDALASFHSDEDVPPVLAAIHQGEEGLASQTAFSSLIKASSSKEQLLALLQYQLKSSAPEFATLIFGPLIANETDLGIAWHQDVIASNNVYLKSMLAYQLSTRDRLKYAPTLSILAEDEDSTVSKFSFMAKSLDSEQILPFAPMPDYSVALATAGQQIILDTSKGEVVIELMPDAPYTSYNFVQLVKSGFLDNNFFDRVIANFVAQGGTNLSYQFGGAGQAIREEVNYHSHKKGWIGMATRGKDTGSSHFFISTSQNYYLDRNYTVFAKVVSGYEVVESMVIGDHIKTAKLR